MREVHMHRSPKLVLGVIVGLALACADSTAPSPSVGSPSFQSAVASDQDRHEQLKQLLEAEKARIKLERENGKLAYELARAEWKTYKTELKRARKLGAPATELLRCAPRPLEGDAEIIGPDGGTLHIGDHELVIPRGALAEEQLIVGRAPTSSLVAVEFEPEGLQFQQAASLSLSYKNCDVPPGLDLAVAYLGAGNRILELPLSQDHRAESEVTGEIHHFSRYAVAY
jgi:hypothetical protein